MWHKVIYSGRCMCGHLYHNHHCCCVLNPEAAKILGDVVPDECDFYGCNEDGGLDENGDYHCGKYVDIDEPDPATRASWTGSRRHGRWEEFWCSVRNWWWNLKWRIRKGLRR